MAWLVFMNWVISQANEWEDYSNYFREGVGISRYWATTHFLTFYGWPQNCHGTGGCVIQLMYYNERIMRLKVYWESNLLSSWTQLVLSSFCHVLWLYHSFIGCALPPSLLFHSPLRDFTLIFLWKAEGQPSVFCNCFKAEQGASTCLSVKNLWMPDLGAPGAGQLLVLSRYGLESSCSPHLDDEALFVTASECKNFYK